MTAKNVGVWRPLKALTFAAKASLFLLIFTPSQECEQEDVRSLDLKKIWDYSNMCRKCRFQQHLEPVVKFVSYFAIKWIFFFFVCLFFECVCACVCCLFFWHAIDFFGCVWFKLCEEALVEHLPVDQMVTLQGSVTFNPVLSQQPSDLNFFLFFLQFA